MRTKTGADKALKFKGYMNHIRDVLLEYGEDILWQLMCEHNNFDRPSTLYQINANNYNEIKFKDPDSGDIKLVKEETGGFTIFNELTSLKNFISFLQRSGKVVHQIDWTKISNDEYMEFVISPNNTTSPANAQMPPSTNPTNTSTHNGQGQRLPPTEADLFKKNVRRDPDLFPRLENDAFHTKWTENTKVIAKAQLLQRVLDKSFQPTVAQEELFHLQCDFMMGVWTKVLQTDKSKSILATHIASNKNTAAQDVWEDLQHYFKNSTVGKDQIEKYQNYCANTKINDGKWKGTTHSYVLHF